LCRRYSNCEDSNFETFKEFEESTWEHEKRELISANRTSDGHEMFSTDKLSLDRVSDALKGKLGADAQSKLVAGRAANNLIDHKYGGTHQDTHEDEDKDRKRLSMNQGPPVFQQYHAPARLQGRSVVTSCWVVRGAPVAACFREDTAKTTNNDSCFQPHYVAGPRLSDAGFYPVSERGAKLRSELYGSAPLERGEGESYADGGSGRTGRGSTGGGGNITLPYRRNWFGSGGSSWSNYWRPSASTHASDVRYDAKKARTGSKGAMGSTGASGKASKGFSRTARTHKVGTTGRSVGRGGMGGGRG